MQYTYLFKCRYILLKLSLVCSIWLPIAFASDQLPLAGAIASYQKLGANLEAGYVDSCGSFVRRPWKGAPAGSLPIFYFGHQFSEVPALPEVPTHFGLFIRIRSKERGVLGRIADLKNLTYLSLAMSRLPDSELRELTESSLKKVTTFV